ncbi:MAG: chorismate mutase [Vicinamibacteria bacterium]
MGSKVKGAIDGWRRKIDAIDDRLLVLLNQRAKCSIEIGWIKRASNMEIYVPSREVQILKRVSSANDGPLNEESVRGLFERIIDESRSTERAVCSGGPKSEGAQSRTTSSRARKKKRPSRKKVKK